MAEALLRLIAGDYFEASSAGTHPVGVNPMTIEVMKELGVDMAHHRSKHVQEFAGQAFDYVVTVCDRAKETCPIFPTASRVLHWSFDDPAAAPEAQRRQVFRQIRDEISGRIRHFRRKHSLPGMLNCNTFPTNDPHP
jgi:arsenate reductase